MTVTAAFMRALQVNSTLYFVLLALAGLDLVVGAGRAILQKRFTSAALRSTATKIIEEIALPMALSIVGVANGQLGLLVPAALWVGIVSEATSIFEHIRGKNSSTLIAGILNALGKSGLPGSTKGGS